MTDSDPDDRVKVSEQAEGGVNTPDPPAKTLKKEADTTSPTTSVLSQRKNARRAQLAQTLRQNLHKRKKRARQIAQKSQNRDSSDDIA